MPSQIVEIPLLRPAVRAVVVSDGWQVPAKQGQTSWLQWLVYGPNAQPRRIGLRNPQGLATGGRELLVCDQGLPDVASLDLATGRLRRWIHQPEVPACPVSVATDGQGRVFVADTTRRAVLHYDSTGRLQRQLAPPNETRDSFRPAAVLLVGSTLLIGNTAAGAIHRYDLAAETWLSDLPMTSTPIPLIAPTGLAIRGPDRLLVVDAVTGTVHELNSQGEWIRSIGGPGRRACEFVRPMHVTATTAGFIVVTDAGKQTVALFDETGACLGEIGSDNGGPGVSFTLPTGLAVVEHPAGQLPRIAEAHLGTQAATWIAVSDPLGEVPLRWIGIVVEGETRR